MQLQQKYADMILTTVDSIEGSKIEKYLGLCYGEAVMEEDTSADPDSIGAFYETSLRKTRDAAIEKMKKEALDMGADAVIGIHTGCTVFRNNMTCVTAEGTAVYCAGKAEGTVPETEQAVPVISYNLSHPFRITEILFHHKGHEHTMQLVGLNYADVPVDAIQAEIATTTVFQESGPFFSFCFTDLRPYEKEFITAPMAIDLPEDQCSSIVSAIVHVIKYVAADTVYEKTGSDLISTLPLTEMKEERKKNGPDAVGRVYHDEKVWLCSCGAYNGASAPACKVCGRKNITVANNLFCV